MRVLYGGAGDDVYERAQTLCPPGLERFRALLPEDER